jgi:hypothetical protein
VTVRTIRTRAIGLTLRLRWRDSCGCTRGVNNHGSEDNRHVLQIAAGSILPE